MSAITNRMMVDIRDENLSEATAFLERAPEASLFLLSKLGAFGPRLGPSLYSGNFQGIRENGKLVAVFCLTRAGSLHVQLGDRIDLARAIVDAAKSEKMPIRGVLGEWQSSKPVWDLLCADGCLRETVASKEVFYRLNLAGSVAPVASVADVRMLTDHDHDLWEPVCVAFQHETGEPLLGSREQRQAAFERSSALGHWWGAFENEQLVSIAAVIALHARVAQIGAVFTIPERRRRGISRAVMTRLILDSRDVHRLARLCLFTEERNTPARQLYESLGFERFGHFGWFF
jgi:predicted GNAT family acetyltransferase